MWPPGAGSVPHCRSGFAGAGADGDQIFRSKWKAAACQSPSGEQSTESRGEAPCAALPPLVSSGRIPGAGRWWGSMVGTHGRGGWRGSHPFSVLTLPEIASGGRGPPETSRAAPGCACQGYQAQAALLSYPHLGQKILLSHPLASAGGPTTLHGFASEGRESAGPAPSRTGDRQTSLSVLLQRRLCCLRASPPAVTAPGFWAALPGVPLGHAPGGWGRYRRHGCEHGARHWGCSILTVLHFHCFSSWGTDLGTSSERRFGCC